MAKKQSKATWGWVKTNIPGKPNDTEKDKVTALFEPLVKAMNERIPPLKEPQKFNQLVEVFSKWRGSSFYVMERYKCPDSPHSRAKGFNSGLAKLTYKSPNCYDLSYFRHTGQWFTVLYEITMEDCLRRVKEDPIFHG